MIQKQSEPSEGRSLSLIFSSQETTGMNVIGRKPVGMLNVDLEMVKNKTTKKQKQNRQYVALRAPGPDRPLTWILFGFYGDNLFICYATELAVKTILLYS